MAATARRYPEGALVYLIEQTDLYLRVRDGVRQVHVSISVYHCPGLFLLLLGLSRLTSSVSHFHTVTLHHCLALLSSQSQSLSITLESQSPVSLYHPQALSRLTL